MNYSIVLICKEQCTKTKQNKTVPFMPGNPRNPGSPLSPGEPGVPGAPYISN